MNEFKKPITQNKKDKCNKLYKELKSGKVYTKSELCDIIGVKNERQVRDILHTLREKVPILSTSTETGYKLATHVADLETAQHTLAELESRQRQLEAAKQPLLQFITQCNERLKEFKKSIIQEEQANER